MSSRIHALAAVFLFLGTACASNIDQAVVKIYSTSADPYYYVPWITNAPYESSGSGCVIDDGLILTNAHIVANETYLQVRREGDPRKYRASVVAVSHDADLALITVRSPSFFDGITPLRFGDLPRTREQVTVYGYPEGGDALSTTQGVISRIETWNYAHSNLPLLAVQIDAAINPGNSGGPAIVNDRIIGVAMQTRTQSENIGYVIPVPVIRHFLEDLEDGVLDGFPSAGFSFQTIRNPAMTERFGVQEEQTGVLVTSLAHESPASKVLETGDVVIRMDGHDVAGDGTVAVQHGTRVSLEHLVSRRQIGESIPLTVIRSGSTLTVRMTLDETFEDLCMVPNRIYDRSPRYCVFAGLVLLPLSLNYLETWGSEWYNYAPEYLLETYFYSNWRTADRNRIPLLAYALPSEVNTGYQNIRNEIVEEVNGTRVMDFDHLVHLLDTSEEEFLELRTNLGKLLVLDREAAIAENEEILLRYGIPEDRQME